MKVSKEKLRKLLVDPGHIKEEHFEQAQKRASAQGQDLREALIEKQLIKDSQLGHLIAEDFGFDYVNLRREKIEKEVLHLIPELVAANKGVIAFDQMKDYVGVGMTDPNDLKTINFIEKRTGQEVRAYYITPNDWKRALKLYKGSLKEKFSKLIESLEDDSISRNQRDELVIKMVDLLLEYGHYNKASDVHIEPMRKKVVVRFRIDGVMHKVLEFPKELHKLILSRIKVLARLRTDEHRRAQDGKLRFKVKSEAVDVRVSIVPITEGENVVMRLLSAKNRQFGLVDLGFSRSNLKKAKKAIKKPHGMVLVTGPTGSGKTTTLYSFLKLLNSAKVHISTIEDPVEYNIQGISQIQVDRQTDLTFAKGLRAIVRQDPDIIMVGEIRDKETAGIAVNSALTGHLVLSTLHTNNAATTLPRLLDMDVKPFLVASTVNIIIAQRLVRKLCKRCRQSYHLGQEGKKMFKEDKALKRALKNKRKKDPAKLTFYKGVGCEACGDTGYRGRTGIFEVLPISDKIKKMITQRASSGEILETAREEGMITMLEDGLEKSLNGETSLEEVLRSSQE